MRLKLTEDYFRVTIFKLKVTGFSQINNSNLYLITFHTKLYFCLIIYIRAFTVLLCYWPGCWIMSYLYVKAVNNRQKRHEFKCAFFFCYSTFIACTSTSLAILACSLWNNYLSIHRALHVSFAFDKTIQNCSIQAFYVANLKNYIEKECSE